MCACVFSAAICFEFEFVRVLVSRYHSFFEKRVIMWTGMSPATQSCGQQGMMMPMQQGMMPMQQGQMMMPMQQGQMMPMQQGMMMPMQRGQMMMPMQQGQMTRDDAEQLSPTPRSQTGSRVRGRGQGGGGIRRLGRTHSGGSGPGQSPRRSRSPRSGMPRFKDDHHGVSSSFKSLGLEHVFGKKRVMPKSFRASMIACCDPVLFPMYRLAALCSQDTDFLNFIVTGCSPGTRPVDFQVETKRQLRGAARDAYRLK